MNLPYTPDAKNKFQALIGPPEDLIICPHCYREISSPDITYAARKGTSAPLFWCKPCQRKFGVKHQSINWPIWFGKLYGIFFTKRQDQHAVYARLNDFMTQSAIRFFNSKLRHYRQYGVSMEEAVEKAFVATIKNLIDKARIRLSNKERDNWSIIINRYNSEQSYELDWKLFQAENAGIVFASVPDPEDALIHCHKCVDSRITKFGFSNAGRRRFKCKVCDESFVLRGRNLFNLEYVKKQMFILFARSFNIKKEHIPMLEQICTDMAREFMKEPNMKSITDKLQNAFTVHEVFRVNEIELFAAKHSGKHKIIRSGTSEIFEKMSQQSEALLLSKPKEHTEPNAYEIFGDLHKKSR